MIRGITHHALEHRHNIIAGRLAQGRTQSISFARAAMLHEWRQSENLNAQPGHIRRPTRIFLISVMALAGLRRFGQVLAQFRLVWQR